MPAGRTNPVGHHGGRYPDLYCAVDGSDDGARSLERLTHRSHAIDLFVLAIKLGQKIMQIKRVREHLQ